MKNICKQVKSPKLSSVQQIFIEPSLVLVLRPGAGDRQDKTGACPPENHRLIAKLWIGDDDGLRLFVFFSPLFVPFCSSEVRMDEEKQQEWI